LFIAITVVLTALAAWLFGSGLARDRTRERELSGSGRDEH
jgi:FlaG/FlaF family flagellin (archaellin)